MQRLGAVERATQRPPQRPEMLLGVRASHHEPERGERERLTARHVLEPERLALRNRTESSRELRAVRRLGGRPLGRGGGGA